MKGFVLITLWWDFSIPIKGRKSGEKYGSECLAISPLIPDAAEQSPGYLLNATLEDTFLKSKAEFKWEAGWTLGKETSIFSFCTKDKAVPVWN